MGVAAPRRLRRWVSGLAVAGLLSVTAPVWGQVFLILTIAVADGFAQRTSETEHPPGTMPLVGPGKQAKTIVRGGPCSMCTTGRRGMSYWGSRLSAATPLSMLDREAHALLPKAQSPRRIQVVALEPMVVLVRDDEAEAAGEDGFPMSEQYLVIHGGRARLWYGPILPGPLAGLSWARPGVPLTPLQEDPGRAIISLPKGRLVLTEAAGRISVTRE
jgi:hypothetical protein